MAALSVALLCWLGAGCGRGAAPDSGTRNHAGGRMVHSWHGVYLQVDSELQTSEGVSTPRIFKPEDPFELASLAGEKVMFLVPHGLIGPGTLDQFADEFGVEVSILSYGDDEELLQFISEGVVDLALAPSFFVSELMELELLARLNPHDMEAIRRIVWTPPVGTRFQSNLPEELLAYSSPYLWSSVGIAYNQKFFPAGISEWRELLMPQKHPQPTRDRIKGRVSMFSGQMDNYASALIALGHPAETSDSNLLTAASHVLIEQESFLRGRLNGRTLQKALADEVIVLAQATGSDAMAARQRNPNIRFVLPEEGTHLYIASLVIPAKSPRRALAEKLFEYLLDPRISGAIANHTKLASVDYRARAYARGELLDGLAYELPRKFQHLQFVPDKITPLPAINFMHQE